MDPRYPAVLEVLSTYFDGLYLSDTTRLREVFHPSAIYATASGDGLVLLDVGSYFPIVDERPSPASLGQARTDRVVSIEFAGPVTARARVECSIPPKDFTDLLTLVLVDDRWQIIAKVFHYELREAG